MVKGEEFAEFYHHSLITAFKSLKTLAHPLLTSQYTFTLLIIGKEMKTIYLHYACDRVSFR